MTTVFFFSIINIERNNCQRATIVIKNGEYFSCAIITIEDEPDNFIDIHKKDSILHSIRH